MKQGRLYGGLMAVAVILIVWTLWNRFVADPGAAEFLAHKSGMGRAIRVPVWLTVLDVHIAAACTGLLAGAVNIATGAMKVRLRLHRLIGYVYVICVLAVVVTSGYMAPYATGGRLVSMLFNFWNLAWLAVTTTALIQIKRRRFDLHRRWMLRSYAFCFTNPSIHLLLTLLSAMFGLAYETAYTGGLIGTMVLLPLAAEAVARSWRNNPARPRKGGR
ncbi:DUF2306 domain-containing protein [Paenibacillus athensensis]|nr:DUF2306 domain-containing protein [Paenibacillus athensensis]MCD1260417.1 DUF2306 domain-containing protein [Paenibacillus athensensis]